MAQDTWVGKKGFQYWYYKYRDSDYFSLVVSLVTVVVCLALVFQFIMPQLQNWFSIRDEIVATRSRIEILERNITFVNNLDRGIMESQLQTATTALPLEKDFGSMLNVLSAASLRSGVALNDFSFQVGNVASSQGLVTDVRHKGLASIKITIVVVGSVRQIQQFIQNVETSIPMAEVVNIDGSGQTISLSVQFYQKAVPDLAVQPDKPLESLSSENVALLRQLATWKKAQPLPNLDVKTATGGAVPLF